MEYTKGENSFTINRYPLSDNRTLRAWSAADEHVLKHLEESEIKLKTPFVYNDSFGFLSCFLHKANPIVIVTNKSQEKAILYNSESNHISSELRFISALEKSSHSASFAIIKIPKTVELFRLFMNHLSLNSNDDVEVVCSFMTKHFTKQILEIAADYFEEVEQSRAWKKSRLLILRKKKNHTSHSITNTIKYGEEKSIQQYFGVFSADHIDYATQFLIEHISLKEEDKIILDLASGNGILGKTIHELKSDTQIHLLDDSYLAVASSQLNLQGENIHFHCNNNLEEFEDDYFDYVISNPPFHMGHEIDISIPLQLFKEVKRCLKPEGHFQLVANQHLNYKTHLLKSFNCVDILAENKKFIIYDCYK